MANVEPFAAEGVCGFLHRPVGVADQGIVLTHGAGGNCEAPLLIAAAAAFCTSGFHALRIDLPFRRQRPKGPPSPSTAGKDREGLQSAAAAMRRIVPGKIILGGQSYGGRQATMLAADVPDQADALVLFSYPLHPPGKPDRLRIEHFPRLRTPCVFVQGTADPFGSPVELRPMLAMIPARTDLIIVDGAGHDLRRGRFDLASVVTTSLPLLT